MDFDVIIVGTGAAGLYCSLNLDKSLKVLLITKSKLRECNSYLAQGGITTVLNKDDEKIFIEDTLRAGKYKNHINAIKTLADESDAIVKDLLSFNMPLDMEGNKLSYTKEAAHSVNRIIHSKDKSGQVLVDTLIGEVNTRKNITIYEDTTLIDILEYTNTCVGVRIFRENTTFNIFAKNIVLAMGGIGCLFKNSTNNRSITGDALAISSLHNIRLKNINYIQFHPTSLYEEDVDSQRFLISESVRGEGAILYNHEGCRFVDELLPRDVVSKAINGEIAKSKTKHVFLDISFKDSAFIKSHFPTIYKKCFELGYDLCKEAIPVTPSQHYFMGGIESDLNGKTSMKNLFAIGEVACTGVHGANRLASNSLLEALTFARKCSTYINSNIDCINTCDYSDSKLTFYDELLDKNYRNNITINLLKEGSDSLNDELFNC